MPKKKTHKKRFAAPKFVANATELENRNNEMDAQKAARRGRRIAAGCDDEDLKDDFDATDGDDGFLGVAADMARMKMEQEEALDNNDDQQKKPKGMSTVIETNNPNAKQKSTLSKKDLKDGKFQKKKLTRKEREQFEKEAAERELLWSGARARETSGIYFFKMALRRDGKPDELYVRRLPFPTKVPDAG